MATFLVLPPRELLEHALGDFFARVMPGVPTPPETLAILTTGLTAAGDMFVLHREDLPDGATTAETLADAFGAEAGDVVVEIGPPRSHSPATRREWVIDAASVSGGHVAR